MESDLTYIISSRNGFGQVHFAPVAFGNAPVTPHCNITQPCNFFFSTVLLLPGIDQRAVMKINGQYIITAFYYLHFKHPLRRLGKQVFLSPFKLCVPPLPPGRHPGTNRSAGWRLVQISPSLNLVGLLPHKAGTTIGLGVLKAPE